jgi:hypothetical protein
VLTTLVNIGVFLLVAGICIFVRQPLRRTLEAATLHAAKENRVYISYTRGHIGILLCALAPTCLYNFLNSQAMCFALCMV